MKLKVDYSTGQSCLRRETATNFGSSVADSNGVLKSSQGDFMPVEVGDLLFLALRRPDGEVRCLILKVAEITGPTAHFEFVNEFKNGAWNTSFNQRMQAALSEAIADCLFTRAA